MPDKFRGINQIEVERYKSIRNLSVDLKAVTVLAGRNSSGKSSVMQPLLLMKQTLDIDSKAALLLQSENVNLTSFDQIRTRIPDLPNDSFSLRVQVENFSAKAVFTGNADDINLISTRYHFFNVQTNAVVEGTEIELSDQTSSEKLLGWVQDVYNKPGHIENYQPYPRACFHGICAQQAEERAVAFPSILRPSDFVTPDIQGIIHLPGLRGNPKRRDSKFSLEQHPFYRGTFPKYTASVIASWERHKNGKYHELLGCLRRLRLATNIKTETGNDWVELKVSRLLPRQNGDSRASDNDDFVSIADVGVGVSQVLPIITALIAAEKNQIVYVEQPETHLHPSALIGLAGAVLDATDRGVKVVIETHSATFLLALQVMVAERPADSSLRDQIALYWFRQNENGETIIDSRIMEENGTYGDWPVDFPNITMELQIKLVDAFNKLEMERE